MCAAWEQPSVASSNQIVTDSLEYCERRIRLHFLTAATRNGEIRSTPGAKSRTIFSTQWLHGKRQRYELREHRPQVDLAAAKPTRLQFITQVQTVASQRFGSFRIRGHPVSRRFEHEPELLAEPVTIAREAATAFELHDTVDTAFELNILPDPLGPTAEPDGLCDFTRQTGFGRERRAPPVRIAFERKRSGRVTQSIDRDFHALHHSRPAPIREPYLAPAVWKVSKNSSLGGRVK
jgi:hypothetical protein